MQVYDPEFVRLMTGQPEEQAESLRQSAEALSQKIIKEKWVKMPMSLLPSKRRRKNR